jgi:alpha-mannosidase
MIPRSRDRAGPDDTPEIVRGRPSEENLPKKPLFLICNAHLDPVWLWEWEEGAAEALSTFRTAARFCEEFEEFVFCHNEALLYSWVEELDPGLFDRIRNLVREGRWHIMGGWYLQPDCNIPGGESFVRQILRGKAYFKDKFGVEPRTAVNPDPFGHSRGLVQILAKSGYGSYLFCRPDPRSLALPSDDFLWEGYDGSRILAHRAPDHYNSRGGRAGEKIAEWLEAEEGRGEGLLLWGIGDHGGGPSREDLFQIRTMAASTGDWDIRHGRPEDYFSLLEGREGLVVHSGDLNPWAVGCYTSMAQVKQAHRCLESLYFGLEKMALHAHTEGVMPYPRRELDEALDDLLFCQFHDILPGSSIAEVEAYALRRLFHGREICERVRMRAFTALMSGQREAEEGEIPLFVYNPHPYEIEEDVTVEFQPHEPLYDRNLQRIPEVKDVSGKRLPCQLEQESSRLDDDWRKRISFRARLAAGRMNRFSCRLREEPKSPAGPKPIKDGFLLQTGAAEVEIDALTGLLRGYRVDGFPFLRDGIVPRAYADHPDPWGMRVSGFHKILGEFRLMSPKESAAFAGTAGGELAPLRIIEDGPVRTVVEALLCFRRSAICLWYVLPKHGAEIRLDLRVFWNERDTMLKLAVPTSFEGGSCTGQTAYGVEEFGRREGELVAQSWTAVLSKDRERALTIINNGTHGFDMTEGEIRPSLLRSAAYAAHPSEENIPLLPQDRFSPRMDQGERIFRFWIRGGRAEDRLKAAGREAQAKNEAPQALCFFPGGGGRSPRPQYRIEGDAILAAAKMSRDGNQRVFRLFQPLPNKGESRLKLYRPDVEIPVSMGPFEIKTLAVDGRGKVIETDLLEREIPGEERRRNSR